MSTRFVDTGVARYYEDRVKVVNWKTVSDFYLGIGRQDLLPEEGSIKYPQTQEVEFGDSAIVVTSRESDYRLTRAVYLGQFEYTASGRLKGKKLTHLYYWNYGSYGRGGLPWGEGVVKEFSPNFYADHLDSIKGYIRFKDAFDSFQSNSEQVVHAFSDEQDGKRRHGLGREAFANPSVAKYFKDDWYLNPFGNDFIVESNKINAPKKFNKKSADKITKFNPSNDTLEIDTDSFGINSSATFGAAKNKRKLKKLAKKDLDFLYDQKKGGLYFNENGADKGFGDGGIIAILKGAPELTSDSLEFT